MSTAPPAALATATRLAVPSATLDALWPLPGGSHATTCLIRTAAPRREMILRVFPAGDPAATDEERALTVIDTLGGLAPRLLARGDEDGKTPSWVLISRLPGTADIIAPRPALRTG